MAYKEIKYDAAYVATGGQHERQHVVAVRRVDVAGHSDVHDVAEMLDSDMAPIVHEAVVRSVPSPPAAMSPSSYGRRIRTVVPVDARSMSMSRR